MFALMQHEVVEYAEEVRNGGLQLACHAIVDSLLGPLDDVVNFLRASGGGAVLASSFGVPVSLDKQEGRGCGFTWQLGDKL